MFPPNDPLAVRHLFNALPTGATGRIAGGKVYVAMNENRCGDDIARERDRLLCALLVDTVFARQLLGECTRLRDLHRLLDISQPTALRLVRALAEAGSLVIEDETHDALASRVVVPQALASQMARARRRIKL